MSARSHRSTYLVAFTLLLATAAWGTLRTRAQSAPPLASLPGGMSDGTTLLPNGWRIQPAGKHVRVGDMPLKLLQTPDSKYLVVSSNGLARPSFSIVDIATWTVKSTMPLDHAWYGLTWHPDGARLYSAGAGQNNVQEFNYANGVITRARTFSLPAMAGQSFAGGVAVAPDGKTLYATRVFAQTVSAIDLTSGQVTKTVNLPAEPYGTVVSADGRMLYVSLWGGAKVQVYMLPSMILLEELTTGEHPNAMVLARDGKRLFVACGNNASVWVFDTFSGEALEQISMSLTPEAPRTSTPNSLALSPDGQTLLVSTADNNAVVVVDVSNGGRSIVSGFVPTGWYPTGAIFSNDGKQIYFLNGKGLISAAKPTDDDGQVRLQGAVSMLPVPDRVTLAEQPQGPRGDAAHRRHQDEPTVPVGSQSARGRRKLADQARLLHHPGEPHLRFDSRRHETGQRRSGVTLFGAVITPNAHALASQFVLFDNSTSTPTSATTVTRLHRRLATDVIQKLWQTYTPTGAACT
jgi:YVTN family beta-propeller protein